MKLLEKLNNYIFGEYVEYRTDHTIRKPCTEHKFNIEPNFKIGTTKYYLCQRCFIWKHVYITRWFRL